MRKAKILMIACGVSFAIPALAEESAEPMDSPVSYNLGVTSDYLFRGITQTNHSPAVQGGVDYMHSSGLYLGAWASNIKWIKEGGAITKGDSSVEVDNYFGIRNTLGSGVGYDLGYVRYSYLGDYTPQIGYNNADTSEIYAASSYKFVTLKYSYSLLDGFMMIPSTKGSNYLDLSARYPVPNSGVTIGAHVGQQNFTGTTSINGVGLDYTDYKLSAAKDFDGYVIGFSYSNTKSATAWGPGGDWSKAATELSVTHSF